MGRKCNNHKNGPGASGEDKINMRRLAGLLSEWQQHNITVEFELYDVNETREGVEKQMALLEPEISELVSVYGQSHPERFGRYGWKERR